VIACDRGRSRVIDFFAIVEQIMQRSFIGGVELVVMLAVLRLDNHAYGVLISREIADATGRELALGSIYAALERLASKGLVVSKLGESTPERGGRAKRYFSLTPRGRREARESQRALINLARGIPSLAGDLA
jgi:PadR family transcriptional regulator, regulatory protein PadR